VRLPLTPISQRWRSALALGELGARERVFPADVIPEVHVQRQRHHVGVGRRADQAQLLVGRRAAGAPFGGIELHQCNPLRTACHTARLCLRRIDHRQATKHKRGTGQAGACETESVVHDILVDGELQVRRTRRQFITQRARLMQAGNPHRNRLAPLSRPPSTTDQT